MDTFELLLGFILAIFAGLLVESLLDYYRRKKKKNSRSKKKKNNGKDGEYRSIRERIRDRGIPDMFLSLTLFGIFCCLLMVIFGISQFFNGNDSGLWKTLFAVPGAIALYIVLFELKKKDQNAEIRVFFFVFTAAMTIVLAFLTIEQSPYYVLGALVTTLICISSMQEPDDNHALRRAYATFQKKVPDIYIPAWVFSILSSFLFCVFHIFKLSHGTESDSFLTFMIVGVITMAVGSIAVFFEIKKKEDLRMPVTAFCVGAILFFIYMTFSETPWYLAGFCLFVLNMIASIPRQKPSRRKPIVT